jgi:chromate transporter
MAVLFEIFFMFAKLSLFSFGGGYVMFPILMREIENNALVTMSELADIIVIAGMSPGAVAVNAAVGVGFKSAGVVGALAAFLGIAIPCAVIVILVATFFFKVCKHYLVQSALYGLRPIITGIILYAAYKIGSGSGIFYSTKEDIIEKGWNFSIGSTHIFEIKSILIAAVAFVLLTKTKIHPIFIIIGSGIMGILIF